MPSLPAALLLIVAVGVGLPVLGSAALIEFASDWRWPSAALHSVVEATGGLIALTLAALLRLRQGLAGDRHPDVWIGAALAGMGILDIFHAVVDPGQSFVWLHSVATLAGGLLFACAILPGRLARSGRLDGAPLAAGVLATGVAVWAVANADALPTMVVGGGFTPTARVLNLAGGMLFLVAAWRFAVDHARTRTWDSLLFSVHCTLFGAAGLLFELSELWDAGWWWWHALRLAAYCVAIGYVLLVYRRALVSIVDLNEVLDEANQDLEQRVQERTEQLEKANQRLRGEIVLREKLEEARWEARLQHAQKLESLGVLAGGIAHDFNNLLVGILGNASLALEDTPKGHRVRPALDQIELTARRAAELTRQMLAYSGKGRFVVEPLDLSAIVREMRDLLEVSISKKAGLRCELDPNLPSIEADAAQLRQVVMNLITNASDALETEDGTITLRTGVSEVDASYLDDTEVGDDLSPGHYVWVEVSDTGCGMSEETRVRMFDPFFTTKTTGRGLGLAATLGIVRGHSGAVRVYSEEGSGTAIKMLFPAGDAEAVVSAPAGTPVARELKGCVLVVDDHEIVRDLTRRVLERAGLEVLEAADGLECLERYRERGDSIDLVLLDLTMPRLGGEETFTELRRIDPSVRVVLMSGYNAQDMTSHFVGRGLATFIQKPFTVNQLLDVIGKQFPE